MGLPVGLRNRAPVCGAKKWTGKHFGFSTAAWELDDPGITTAGGFVTSIPDRNGNGAALALLGAGVGNRPAMEAVGWGGTRPSMLFDGANDYAYCDAAGAIQNGSDKPMSLLMALECVSTTATDTLWSFGRSTSGDPYFSANIGAGDLNQLERRGDGGLGLVTRDDGRTLVDATRIIYGVTYTGTAATTFINGVAVAIAGAIDTVNVTINQFTIAALRKSTISLWAEIRVGCIWLGPTALPSVQMTQASAVMAARWPTT